MTKEELTSRIETIQDKLNNIKIMLAVPMAVIMCLYFFTYASLIDMDHAGFLYAEIGTSVVFFLVLFNLNMVGYRLLRMRLAGKEPYKALFEQLNESTINMPLAKLTDKIAETLLDQPKNS